MKSAQFADFSLTGDWHECMQFIYNKLDLIPKIKCNYYGIGISMGGNILVRYQGLYHKESRFKALISISNPFDV